MFPRPSSPPAGPRHFLKPNHFSRRPFPRDSPDAGRAPPSAATRRAGRARQARPRPFCRRTATLCRKTWAWKFLPRHRDARGGFAGFSFWSRRATSFAVVTLKTSSTVVMPCRDETPAVFGERFSFPRGARRRGSGRSRRISKPTGGFPRRCPSTQKSRAGQKIRCCGIRGSRRICKSSCSPGMPSFTLSACARR